MGEASDLELLTQWRVGDKAAGDALVGRHFEAIYRFFRNKVSGDVEDLVQRTFLSLLEAHASVHTPSVRSFLFRLARNRLFDHFRKQQRRPTENLGSRSVAELGVDISARIASAETREIVVAALQSLPLDFQMTLELAYWEGLSGEEIAAALEVSPHTVRSRLSRGRGMLRKALERQVDSPDLLARSLRAVEMRVAKRPPDPPRS